MATAAKKDEGENGGEYKRPDAARAFDIYDKYIAPKKLKISELAGDCSEPWQDIKKHAHFPRAVMNFLINLENVDDDAKRDHFLLALSEGLTHRKLFLPRDLVTIADGEAGGDIVPTEDRPRMKLVGVDDDFQEASEEELAAQEGRKGAKAEEEPAPGTGAAALKAMKGKAAKAEAIN